MKIKNDLVSLKIGDKQYDFNNLILDEYLKRFANAQLDLEHLENFGYSRLLSCCLIKFDTPIKNIQGDLEIENQGFDICFFRSNNKQNVSEQQIIIQYEYNTDAILDYAKNSTIDISNYYGKKITAIGFNSYHTTGLKICAIMDVSNYNIYLQKNQDIAITRRDIITTDAMFYSNNINKVPGPVHLCPDGVPQIIHQPNIYNQDKTAWSSFNNKGYGILYSIGLSSYPDYIDKEFIIEQDIQVENKGIELNINGLENYLTNDSPLFCGENIYASTNLYPVKTNYKYIIFKYKAWQKVHSGSYGDLISEPTDTGYYYYQAIPIEKFGKSDLKIKYERG